MAPDTLNDVPEIRVGDVVVEVRRMTVTIREAADVLGWEPRHVYALVRARRLSNVAYGACCRLDPDELASFTSESVAAGQASHLALARFARLVATPRLAAETRNTLQPLAM